MTDNDLHLDAADAICDPLIQQRHAVTIGRLLDALRASDRDLATARAVTRRLLDGWETYDDAPGPRWHRWKPGRGTVYVDDLLTDAERAWLASVSPPTSEAP